MKRRQMLGSLGALAMTGQVMDGLAETKVGKVTPGAVSRSTGEQRFCETLSDLSTWVDSFIDTTEQERAEGHAYIAGMARWAISRALVSSDTDRPGFVRCMDGSTRWGLENPDNIYQSADIRGNYEYILRGQRGTSADFEVEVLTGLPGDGREIGNRIDAIGVDKLKTDANGNFEIQIGGDRSHQNGLKTKSRAGVVFMRHTIADSSKERAGWITIERVDPPPEYLEPNNLREVSFRWDYASRKLKEQVMFLESFAEQWRRTIPVNAFNSPSIKGAGFMPGQQNTYGQFRIKDDEALLVSVKPVNCRFASIMLGNYRWYCSLDNRYHQSALNHRQARVSSDGNVHYVISNKDPGVANWLETAGHLRGFVFMRWQGIEGELQNHPNATLLPIDGVRDILPPDEPQLDVKARRQQIHQHGLAYERHFA